MLMLLCIPMGCTVTKIASSSEAAGVLLPSEIIANSAEFDGKHVDVRGYVVIGPESRNIFDSQEGAMSRNGACLGLAGSNSMFSTFQRRMTQKLSGIFRRHICGPNDVCLYWCGESGIELDTGGALIPLSD